MNIEDEWYIIDNKLMILDDDDNYEENDKDDYDFED